jgi:uncharacterized protein (TIGR01732 family)
MLKHMNSLQAYHNHQRGFALIVVLFSLLVLTALFAISQSRSMSHLRLSSTELALLETGHTKRSLLELSATILATRTDPPENDLTVVLGGDEYLLFFQDVGGLIDLNSASPEILSLLGDHFKLSPAAMQVFRDWRRTPRRLLRISDFARITGIAKADVNYLHGVATVHSGRPGIAGGLAPAGVLDVLGFADPADLPDNFKSPATGTTFLVILRHGGGVNDAYLGVIRVGETAAEALVLEIF